MQCLTPEQLVRYLRSTGAEALAVEEHVRDCPACAFQLLLARETLHELGAKSLRPDTDRKKIVRPVRREVTWIPWAAAAAALIVALLVSLLVQKAPERPAQIAHPSGPVPPRPPEPPPPPVTPPREPRPPVPAPRETPIPPPLEAPRPPVPPPKTDAVPPPAPVPAPAESKPAPEPRPAPPPTTVERPVIARVTHAIGGAVGRALVAGETLLTARQEFVTVALEGFGNLYIRENSRAEFGAGGAITLHEGDLLARIDPGRHLGPLKTPFLEIDLDSPLFAVQATKTSAEVSVIEGKASAGPVVAKGPAALWLRAAKAPEVRPLEAGFLSWLPDKLAIKKFSGWYEARSFQSLQGFRVMEHAASPVKQAAVQVAEGGMLAHKIALPYRGRYAVWVRVRQYEAKAPVVGLHVNNQPVIEVKLDGADRAPWRWVGPLLVNSDHADLTVTALSRWPWKENDEKRSFPVLVDLVWVTGDQRLPPPEKPLEERRSYDLGIEDVGK